MCKAMEDMREDAKTERSLDIAIRMIKEGRFSLEEIANYSLLTLDKVIELAGA